MKDFDEFVREGLVRTQRKDVARARSLVEETRNRTRFLKSIPAAKENASYIVENAYDIIRELIEARLSMDGYKSYSHEATVAYLKKLGFPGSQALFIDDMRKVRNGIKYYGGGATLDYALTVLKFLETAHEKLEKLSG